MTIREISPLFNQATSKPINPLGLDLKSPTRREFYVTVTPDCADWLLKNMHPNQREPSWSSVRSFEEIIRAKKFVQRMAPGIYTDHDGYVVNARHRLTAQLNCKATLEWHMVIGAPDEEIAALDQTRPRRIHQSVNLVYGQSGHMTSREEAALRLYRRLLASDGELRKTYDKSSVEQILEVRERFGEDVAWAISAIPNKAGPASLVGVVAYARPIDPDRVAAFCAAYVDTRLVLCRDVYDARDPGVTFARFMNTSASGRAGQAYTDIIVEKALGGIRASIENRKVAHLYGNDDRSKHVRWFQDRRKKMAIDR